MAPSAPATHESAPGATPAPPPPPAAAVGTLPAHLTELSGMALNGLDQSQIMNLLRQLPHMFNKLAEGQGTKEDAAQTLSNLAQQPFGGVPVHFPPGGIPGINDPGPSSHPRGPPNLGQLSAVAMQAAPVNAGQAGDEGDTGSGGEGMPSTPTPATGTGGRRGGRNPAMGSDEWSRQRKDNHKEVERRRRGNINEGINELGRIVPSGSGEKAKGAILSRAVQYIHHLKENEARNIEKWTLEKLLMDQAMGDLQAQLEEVKRMWEDERMARNKLQGELNHLQSLNGVAAADGEEPAAGTKRRSVEAAATEEADRDGKRQRTD